MLVSTANMFHNSTANIFLCTVDNLFQGNDQLQSTVKIPRTGIESNQISYNRHRVQSTVKIPITAIQIFRFLVLVQLTPSLVQPVLLIQPDRFLLLIKIILSTSPIPRNSIHKLILTTKGMRNKK